MGNILLLFIIQLLFNTEKINGTVTEQISFEGEISVLKAADNFSKKEISAGLSHLKNALLNSPENDYYKLYLAMLYTADNKHKESLKILEKIKDIPLKYFYKSVNIISLNPENSKLIINELENIKTQNIIFSEEKYLYLAVIAHHYKQTELSKYFFDSAIKINPNLLSLMYQINPFKDIVYSVYENMNMDKDVYYYNSLGALQIRFKDINGALFNLKESLKLDKNNPVADKLLAETYISDGNNEKALEHLKKAEKFFFQNEDIFLSYYSIYKDKPAKDRLEICLKGLNNINSSFMLTYCVAQANYELGNYEKAKYYSDFILYQQPNNFEANLLMGDISRKLETLLEAKFENGLISEEELDKQMSKFEEPMSFYSKAMIAKPFDFQIASRIYEILSDIKIIKNTGTYELDISDDIQENIDPDLLKKIQTDFDKYISEKNREENNIKFYNHFKKYVTTKDINELKELKYLKISKIMMDYLTYFDSPSLETYKNFMDKFEEKYIEVNTRAYKSNEMYFFHELTQEHTLEQLKEFNFIIPENFN